MAACPRCGADNPERAKFCNECATPLSSALRSAGGRERKVVTVLFSDLVGFTARAEAADPEEVHATLAPYHALAKAEIERFGGVVEKFVGDAVMAVFGVPRAHEDDPERAVRAALSILDGIADLNTERQADLAVRIGIYTGEVLVALDADPAAGELVVAGDAVNTAARLQGAAPEGAAVVGEPTFRATRDRFAYEELDPIALKGKARPIGMWRVLDPVSRVGREARTHTSPLVGREAELRLLEDALECCIRNRSPRLVTISGEPGVGKSRLVAELGRLVDARPEAIAWREGRCLSYGEGITFWALGEIVKGHAGILESDDAETVAAKLARVLPSDERDREWLRQRLAPLVGLQAGAPAGRAEAFAAWGRFLAGIADAGPAVFVIEDLHWADATMLDFLEHLVGFEGIPMLLVTTTRPELYDVRERWGGGSTNAVTINLLPLGEIETARLASLHLGAEVLPAALERSLLERSGGNPLFVEESVRLLFDLGLVVRRGNALVLKESVEIPLSEGVRGLIAARLDALTPQRKALLQDASVVGRVFWCGAVAAIGDRDVRAVEEEVQELARREFVRSAPASSIEGEAEYSFWHALVRDVAYAQIPRTERVGRHRRAAAWIEQTSDRVEDSAEILAHHYTSALGLARSVGAGGTEVAELEAAALRFLVLAAERALGLDTAAAEAHYARALELTPAGDPRRPAVQTGWAQAVFQAGRIQEAAAALEDAISTLLDQGEEAVAAAVMTTLAPVLWSKGERRSRDVAARAVEMLGSKPPSPELVAAYAELARRESLLGDHREASAAADAAFEVATKLGLEQPAKALGYRGMARGMLGDIGGVEDVRIALALTTERGHGQDAAAIYNNLGLLLWLIEGPRAAEGVFREGVEFCERRGLTEAGFFLGVGLVGTLVDLGSWDQALAVVGPLAERAEANGALLVLGWIRFRVATVLALSGRPHEALPLAEWAAGVARDMGAYELVGDAVATSALARLGTRDRAGALELLAELPLLPIEALEYAFLVPTMVRVAVSAGDVARAERFLEGVEPGPFPNARTAVLAARAAVAEARGDAATGSELYAEVVRGYGRSGNRYEEGCAFLGWGRCLLALGDPQASQKLAAAREIFASLGAEPALSEADGLLARAMAASS